MRLPSTLIALVSLAIGSVLAASDGHAQATSATATFWSARDTVITANRALQKVRIGIWDSGVDTALFATQLARNAEGQPLLRGYDSFKRRQDTPLAVLAPDLASRVDELARALTAFDDLDASIDSPKARAMDSTLKAMTPEQGRALSTHVSTFAGFSHGTNVADIAVAGNAQAEIVIARMQWWQGNPPVPCWTRELADREAESIRDLLEFLVASGARVVNMSWGRYQSSYRRNLEQCAHDMRPSEREAISLYSVDTVRKVLHAGMAKAPNVLFVAASGNAGTTVEVANPATRFSLPNFMLVGAVDDNGSKANYTNTGPEVTLYADGNRVPARLPGGLMSYPTGTSMATPNVAGAAAKMLAVNPRLTGAQLRTLLEQTADTNATGQRLLHTRRAVSAARAMARSR